MKYSLLLSCVCALVVFLGCAPKTQAQIEKEVRQELASRTKPAVEILYAKVLDKEEMSALNKCIADSLANRLTQEEKLFLVGNPVERAAHAEKAGPSLQKKTMPNSPEMKSAISECSIALGLSKIIDQIKK